MFPAFYVLEQMAHLGMWFGMVLGTLNVSGFKEFRNLKLFGNINYDKTNNNRKVLLSISCNQFKT